MVSIFIVIFSRVCKCYNTLNGQKAQACLVLTRQVYCRMLLLLHYGISFLNHGDIYEWIDLVMCIVNKRATLFGCF